MRKSFTLLFSTLILLCAFGFSSFAAAPVLATTDPLTPANGAVNVKPTITDLVVKFNQNVKFTATGGTLTILKGTTLVKTVTLASGNANAVIKDNTLTVKHGLTLTDGSVYHIGITNNAIENAAGEKFAGITSGQWSFTTGDYTAPVVKTLTPAKGATGVDVQADPFNLVVEFDDVNNINFVAGKKVWLYKEDGTIVDIVVLAGGTTGNVSVTGKTATIKISNNAYVNEYTKYYVNIEAGAFVDMSTNANKYAGMMNKTSWTFSSQDYSAASIVSKSVDNITGTGGTLNVELNEKGYVWYLVQPASATAPSLPVATPSWTRVATNDAKTISVALTGLTNGTEYTVYLVAENLLSDIQETITDLDFKTVDTVAPTASNNREVKVNNVTVAIKLDFTEKVVAGTGDILIKQQSNNATVRTIAAADVEIVKPENSSVWVMTAGFEGLESAVGYYVIVPDGFVKDEAGNNYVSTFKTTTAWMFTSGDFVKPTVEIKILASTPPVASDNIEIKFSEAVKLAGTTTIESISGGNQDAWFNYIALEKNNVAVGFTATYTNGIITVDPTSLSPNSTYVVKIRAKAIEDLAGNKFSDVHYTKELVTGDFGAASITYVPADAALAVAKGTQPKITFSKEAKVKPGTAAAVAITPENLKPLVTFKKTNSGGDNVAFSVTWDAATRTAVLVPDAELASGQVYYVAIDYTKIVDTYGTVFPNPGTATFTMKDYIAPAVTFSHNGTVTDLLAAADLILTFSETVTLTDDVLKLVVFKQTNADGVNLPFNATWDAGTKKITINPNADLEDGKVYYYGVGAGVALDGAGNKNAASFASFTFAPAVPDMLKVAEGGYAPAIGATNVKLNSSNQLVATLTFTEAVKANPVMPTNHNAYLYQEGNATPVATVEILASYFVSDKLTITFTPAVALVSEGKYYITLDANVVVANANNSKTFAGIAANVWKFTAADILKPEFTVLTPLAGATGVALDAAVKLTVNEKITAGTGNITIAYGTTDVKTIAVGLVEIDNTATPVTITIPHAALTQYATVYTVTIPAGAFKDMAGNASDAVTPWTFTTIANPAPAKNKLSPADDEDMVAAGTSKFIIEFTEEVQKGPAGSTAYLLELSGATRATLSGGVINPGTDILRGSILVENATAVQVAGNVVTLDFGFALVDGKEYFILIEDGMFKDKSQPATTDFTGYEGYGTWNFFTKDVNVPTWEVTYEKRGTGMDITSDIVITFSKPIEKAAGGEISSADVATLFNLSVGATPIAFTGNINAEKTVVVLENASFIPALTTANSGQLVSVAPKATSIRGKVNQGAVSTTAVTFNVSDYVAPTATLVAGTINDGEEFNFVLSSNEAGTLYWVVQKGTSTLTAAEVKAAGTPIAEYTSGPKTVLIEDVDSESEYTVYAVAEDATGNISVVATLLVETPDITDPVLLSKSPDFVIPVTGGVYSTEGTLTLVFSEDVDANGAVAIIRKADTREIIANNVPLVNGAADDTLRIVFNIASFNDTQKFIIEIEGGQVEDLAGNTWEGQIGLDAKAWTVGLRDRTAPTLTLSAITPEYNSATNRYVKPVAVDGVFTLTFNENVKLATNRSFLIKYYDFDGQPYNINNWKEFELLESNRITISGNKITIDPARAFWPREDGTLSAVSDQYELIISAGSILDMAGNAYASSFTGLFNIVDNKAPVATFVPANNATGVSQTGNLKISFNEALLLADGTVVDMYDLETLVYLKKGGETVAHVATIDAAKKEITIDPASSLEKGAVYTYGFTAGLKDAAGNAVAAKEVSFTVITDAMIDALITFDPDNEIANQPTVVPVDQAFRIIFSGELFTYSLVNSENNIAVTPTWLGSSITLMQDVTVVPFTASIESRTAEETVVVVTPNAALLSEKPYVLTVLGNKLQLGVGNQTILTAGKSNNYFTTDVIAPVALSRVPSHQQTVSKSTTMAIHFNEKVKPGVGQVKIYHKHGELVMTVDAADLINGSTDFIIEAGKLTELTPDEYYVIIPAGVITDLAGNPWAGVAVEDEWTFTINEDLAQPVITDIAPEGGNTVVNTRLTITFDRAVVLNPNYVGFIAIYDANGVAFQLIRVNDGAANITFNGDKTIATININTLAENTKYFVEVEEGTFVSQADPTLENAGVIRSIWSFTTETNTPPSLLLLTPLDNATDVSLRTVAKMGFNMDVKAGTGAITLRRGADGTVVHSFDVTSSEVVFTGKTVSFDISSYLEADATNYYIIVPAGAITNASTTPEVFAGLEQTTSWNFTTQGDGVKPELVTWTPDEVEIDDNHPTFVMEFNEDVKLVGDVNLVVTKVGETTPALELPLTASMFDGTTVTVAYEERISGVLEYSSEYYVTIEGGAIEDLWENVWEDGVTDTTAWTFHTKDVNTAIAQIQGTGPTSPMLNEVVHVTGTVTGISTGEGFWMQDENAAWSGIWVAYGTTASLNIGDGVYVFGSVAEVAEVTTINASSVEMVDAPVEVAPVVVDGPSAAKAEMYESVLVQVDGARANAANSSGVWTVYYEATNMVAVNKWLYTYTPVAGNFYNVAGIVNGRLSDYKLEPRMASDITDLTATNVPVVVVDFKVYPNPFNDRISIDNHDKLTRVVITNIAGQRVVDVQFPEREIRTANLVSGVYVISLFTEDGMVKSDRIVKR